MPAGSAPVDPIVEYDEPALEPSTLPKFNLMGALPTPASSLLSPVGLSSKAPRLGVMALLKDWDDVQRHLERILAEFPQVC